MQFFFRGLLVAAITYFLKLVHNNHGLHIYCSYHGPPTGRRNNGPSTGRRTNGPSTGHIINGPYTGHMINWQNMGQQRTALWALNGPELELSGHGPTIMGRRLIGRI